MGKCEKCGKRIQYNRYKEVDGKYYCPECVPLKKYPLVKVIHDDDTGKTHSFYDVSKEIKPKKKHSRKKHEKSSFMADERLYGGN